MDGSQYPTFILQVNINCCKACPKKLKKLMLKLNGVDSVEVEPEKRLVYVKGKIDPKALIKMIKSKMNKIATLVPSTQSDNDNNKKGPDEKSNQAENDKNRNGQCGEGSNEEGYCCADDSCRGGGHKEEGYRGVWGYNRVDEEVCRDKYCLFHKWNFVLRNGPFFPQRGYGYCMPPPPPAFGGGRILPVRPPPFGYGYNANDLSCEGCNRGGCTIM